MTSGKVFLFAGLTFVIIGLMKLQGEGSATNSGLLVIGLALVTIGLATARKRQGDDDAR